MIRVIVFTTLTILFCCSSFSEEANDDSDSCDLYYPVFRGEKWGAISKDGQLKIGFIYDWLYFNRQSSEFIVVESDSIKMVIDHTGDIVKDSIPYENFVVIDRDNILIEPYKDRSVDTTTYKHTQIKADHIITDIVHTKDTSLQFIINTSGKIVLQKKIGNQLLSENEFYAGSIFTECGIALVVGEDFWGYINGSGQYIWRKKEPALKYYWKHEETKHLKKDSHEIAMVQKGYDILKKIEYVIRDINARQNTDFGFLPYQSPFEM